MFTLVHSCCFVLMEAKTEASYKKVLERFKLNCPNVRPTSIMVDFETGLCNTRSTYIGPP